MLLGFVLFYVLSTKLENPYMYLYVSIFVWLWLLQDFRAIHKYYNHLCLSQVGFFLSVFLNVDFGFGLVYKLRYRQDMAPLKRTKRQGAMSKSK